jgi:hypothetical protein
MSITSTRFAVGFEEVDRGLLSGETYLPGRTSSRVVHQTEVRRGGDDEPVSQRRSFTGACAFFVDPASATALTEV